MYMYKNILYSVIIIIYIIITDEINMKMKSITRLKTGREGPAYVTLSLKSDIKTYRCLPSLLKYEVSRLRTVWVITVNESLDSRKIDRQTDGQSDYLSWGFPIFDDGALIAL